MPLVRYEIRNEYSLANPELYGAASKDDPQSLLEGVAMAGLVGIVRQLGDLAEFAAEIFHDLHEEVMATAARGHRLMVRVQQLEAEFPSVEKALMSENNQIRFAYTVGADWHASIRNDQNHLTQGDLPRFILNSYEECRGPPRLFLLDKFDIAGAGACLKRYTDPSFFKMEWASSELMKAEKAQREKKARRVKKKGRRRRNGETPNIVPTSELNSRIRYSSLDLDGPKHVPGNLGSTFSQKLKSKQANESPVMDQQIRRNYMQGSSFNLYLPKEDDPSPENLPLKPKQVCGSSLQDQVLGRIHLQGPSYMSLHKEDAFKSSSQECEEKPLAGNSHGVQLRDNLDRVPVLESQSLRNGADIEVEKMPDNCMHAVQKDVLVNGERKMVVNDDEDHTDDVASEIDNYMDALTTMESEMETDSESRTKHEVDSDINSEHREMGFETSEELHEKHAQCSNFVDTEASADFYNCETSDDSLKAKSSSRFFNMESADGFANVESTIHTVNNMLEDDLANVELPTCLTSACVPVGMSNNESISGLDNSISSVSVVNSLSSESLNNVQIRANEERLSDTDIAPAISVDAVSYTILGKAQTTDVLNHGSSAAFANADSVGVSVNAAPSAEVDKGEASFRLAASELSLISTDADLQTPTNKEPLDVLNDGSSAGFANVDNDGVSVTGTPAAELDNGEAPFRLATSELPLASTDVDLRIPTNKEPLDVLNDGSSVGFANVDTAGVSVTGTPASELDKGEASFRLATSVLSFISTDVDLHSPPSKEPLVAAESSPVSSEDMMADVELQIDSLEVDKVDDPVTSVFCADSAINESVVFSCTSESPTGIKNAIMQDEHECIELHTDDAENGASAKHINGESFHSQCTELLPRLSSYEPVGQMSVESDIQIAYNGSPADCRILSDSVHVEFLGPSMDAEVVGDKVCGVLSIDSATPMNSVVALQQNEDPAEYACIKSVPDVMPMEALLKSNLPVDFQDAKMSENDLSKILTAKISSIELVVDSLGNKMTDSVESSNVLVNPHIEDLSDDILVKEMHTDLAQPVPADAVHVELPSANVCREGLPNEFIQAEPDGILGSEIPTVSLNALFPPAFLHSSAAGSHEDLVSYESHTDLDTGMPAEVLNVKSPASSFDEKLTVDSLHTYSGTQPCKTLSPAKSVDAAPYVKAESLSNCPRAEAPDTEPPSPPLEHIKISFHPPAESPLSTYATSSDHVSESPSPERYPLYENKTDDLSSSFHLLPEPAIPLQQGAENQTIRDLGSLSLHGRRKSSEIIPDKIQFSQIIDTDDDSENGDSEGFEKSSPNFPGEFCNKPLEPTSELAGFSGMTAINNGDTGSPRVSWSTSMSSSLSPDTTRSSFLPKVKCSSVESGSGASHSSNVSVGSSLRSPIFSALHSPISPEGTYHDIQAFSKSQSTDLESELLVPTSPTLEPKFLASDSFDDMPPLPPLPPLEWRIMKPRQRPSLPLLEGIEPLSPPAPPPLLVPDSPAQDPPAPHLVPAVQKVPIEQKDSLIEAIASHDKTTLKKVTKQTRPVSSKPLDDREVLLEQIRTRSFSLRHTVVVKHNIPRPVTNINVAAILEKANAIRQAFVGSDEDDDDDDWSDA